MFLRDGMRAILLGLLGMWMLVASAVAQEKSAEASYRIPQDAVDALNNGTEFVLYSLDPPRTFEPQHLKPEEDFYGFKILGRLALTDPKKRSAVVNVVTDHIQHADWQQMALCFLPRHALRVTANGRVFDFVICYQCSQIRLYEKGTFRAKTGISKTPEAPSTLNKLLSDAGIPLAEPSRK